LSESPRHLAEEFSPVSEVISPPLWSDRYKGDFLSYKKISKFIRSKSFWRYLVKNNPLKCSWGRYYLHHSWQTMIKTILSEEGGLKLSSRLFLFIGALA
jgi:hypothetical protein